MNLTTRLKFLATAAALLVAISAMWATPAAAQNLLANPNFDDQDTSSGDVAGVQDWIDFNGGVFTTSQALPQTMTAALSEPNVVKMFGPFEPDPNAAGILQSFPVNPGDVVTFSASGLNWSSDPLTGDDTFQTFGALKLDFKDVDNNSLLFAEEQILPDAPLNEWLFQTATLTAPAGAVSVEGVLLHVAKDGFGGSIFWDNASLEIVPIPEPTSMGLAAMCAIALVGLRRRR